MEKILILFVVIGMLFVGYQYVSKNFSGPSDVEKMHAACLQLSPPVTLEELKKLFGEVYGSASTHMFRFNNMRYAVKYTDEIHGAIDEKTKEVSELWCSDKERIW